MLSRAACSRAVAYGVDPATGGRLSAPAPWRSHPSNPFFLPLCPPAGVPVTILDPGCTRKTFPTYFDVLETVAKH